MCTQLFDVKQDYVFKRIFGSKSHPDILISFLNSCFKGKTVIKTVKIENSKIEREFIEDSYSRLDILATTDKDEIINIEMQRADEKNMVKRSLYYWAKTFSSHYKGKSEYEKIPRTVCINILDFKLEELRNEPYFHNVFNLKNEKTNENLTEAIEIQFIELPKLIKSDKNKLSIWTKFIDDPNSLDVIEAEKDIKGLHEAREELVRISRDPKEAEIYRQRADALSDKHNALLSAEKKGELKGKIEIAKKSLSQGLDVNTISLITGLTIEEIEKLKKPI